MPAGPDGERGHGTVPSRGSAPRSVDRMPMVDRCEPATPQTRTRGPGSLSDTKQRERILRRRLETVIGTPFTEGNAITVLRNGDRIFPAMLEAIRNAESTVDLCTFVYWQGDIAVEFAQAMSERAQAGVRVRLLIDALGGRLIEKSLVTEMDRAGVQVE